MPVQYIPYVPNPIEGQAILDNITRTRRVLRYTGSGQVYDHLRRGLPLYETVEVESVGDDHSNLLLRGECLSACAYLKDKGVTLDLVYIDPPFASGADYAKSVYLRRNPHQAEALAEAEAKLELDELRAFEEKMYGDIWNKEDYLNWMFENLMAIKSVMSSTASIYVHLDWNIGHYVKVMMDEIFGENNFEREIIWRIGWVSGYKSKAKNFIRNHDTIFYYTKTENKVFNKLYIPYPEGYTRRDGAVPEGEGYPIEDTWNCNNLDSMDSIQIMSFSGEKVDYATQKNENLLRRIILSSSNEKREDGSPMIVGDFFGGSGVTAKVAHDLGRQFIHVDVGVNSLQTARDRLKAAGASFRTLEIQDGVSLFRNPIQTMDKLKTLIVGLKNEAGLGKFWEGAIQDSKLGMMPVYLPNLADHQTKVLDLPLINRVIQDALPELPDDIKQVIVYFVDIYDRPGVEKFIKDHNMSGVDIELRDLKTILDEIVINDELEYQIQNSAGSYTVQIDRFDSDRLHQKIDEYNQKKSLTGKSQAEHSLLNTEENDEAEEILEESPRKKTPFRPIRISENGLELIEWVSLDCTNTDGSWHSDSEIKIDKKGFVIRNGKKTKEFWDAKITCVQKPLRLKVRNIAGDESILAIP